MDQIFNELSANGSYADKYAASLGIERMLELSQGLKNCGYNSTLRVVENFCQLDLSPGYTIHQWVRDRSIGANRDLQRALLTFATRAPYVEQFIADTEKDAIVEFLFEGQVSYGLGLAYLWNSSALSLDGDAQFLSDRIPLQFHRLDEMQETTESIAVSSISTPMQLADACNRLRTSQIASIDSGEALVSLLPELFAFLKFSPQTEKQMSALSGREQYFPEIVRHLAVIDQTMSEWHSGTFDPQEITWSPESSSTLQQFAAPRTIVCQDGVSRLFSFHSKLMSANQRIHFYPVTSDRVVHIGYIGKHLPTSRHRT